LAARMQDIIKRYGLSIAAIEQGLTRRIGVHRMEVKGQLYTAVNNDCVLEAKRMPYDYAGLIHTSIPFGNHYEYSVQYEDFGHNPTDAQFWEQMDFLLPELLRILKPGRVAAIHVKDRILYGHQTKSGFMEVAPFSDECVAAFRRHGFLYEGRRTITTDVVRENASTYRLGWTEMTKDASKMGSGLPEYLLLFRKPPSQSDNAYADEPVTHSKTEYTRARWQVDAHSHWNSNGNRPLFPDEVYDYEQHIARLEAMEKAGTLPASFFSEPPKSHTGWVWDDVIFMRTLNTEQNRRKQENHICPLPFDIVERTIRLYSNEGEVVFDPFAGLFTVPYMAIKLGRYGHGVELTGEYFSAGVRYCQDIERKVLSPTLFDFLKQATQGQTVGVSA
jgi:DNA modification methylase